MPSSFFFWKKNYGIIRAFSPLFLYQKSFFLFSPFYRPFIRLSLCECTCVRLVDLFCCLNEHTVHQTHCLLSAFIFIFFHMRLALGIFFSIWKRKIKWMENIVKYYLSSFFLFFFCQSGMESKHATTLDVINILVSYHAWHETILIWLKLNYGKLFPVRNLNEIRENRSQRWAWVYLSYHWQRAINYFTLFCMEKFRFD